MHRQYTVCSVFSVSYTHLGMGGNLSFVFALLDYTNTGFVLNCIHSREGCYIYMKEVDRGQTEVVLGKDVYKRQVRIPCSGKSFLFIRILYAICKSGGIFYPL